MSAFAVVSNTRVVLAATAAMPVRFVGGEYEVKFKSDEYHAEHGGIITRWFDGRRFVAMCTPEAANK
ncbi:MAG: hypothetical protein AAF542_18015 [Pseudomonadota bacterium]